MSQAPFNPILAARFRALALEALKRPASPFSELPDPVLVVDPFQQRLGLLKDGSLRAVFTISTAAKGLGCEEGSFRTPVGWHRVHARIGEGAPPGAVFRERVPTGEVWDGTPLDEDLILTRVITLVGLEPGINQGPGCDSLDRTIYAHGTNQEALLGQAVSHGCLRLSNQDVTELFGLVREGDALVVAETDLADGLGLGRLHFAGLAGSGMSALAQFVAMKGGRASGSDRAFDRDEQGDTRLKLEALGVMVHPQDGSGLEHDCAALVLSTAVEETVPDVAAARKLGVPLLHRSELLAHFTATHRTVAVTGTSGKSTTTAMIFELLRGAGRDPGVITGGELLALQAEGLMGNAWAGASDLLVVEADESDGSVVRYHPAVGVVLNLQKDHKAEAVVAGMFREFIQNLRESLVLGEAGNLAAFRAGAVVFGFGADARVRAEHLKTGPAGSQFSVDDVLFDLTIPGLHNVENALAALAACQALGVPLEDLAAPLRHFKGVGRRFQVLGEANGITVVDDFGHNPAKIAASLRTAHLRAGRVLAVFQPHGFGPLRFLRAELAGAFAAELSPQDHLWMLEAFYAGGTTTRDVSSADLVADLRGMGCSADFAGNREALIEALALEARAGDLILIMGARDPSLTELAREILARLHSNESGQSKTTGAPGTTTC
ncbi:MAG: L,D-transpeptidase family protein [Acidobacteriota bacterium]|nr:L,D-transpeptidase family protein [Acidobacteriota bacterium]